MHNNKINTELNDELYWYVFYTRSRFEKKVFENLKQLGYESFLPLVKTVRKWSDRKKIVELPLFSSYIFIRISKYNISEITKINGIIRYIVFNNRPAIIKDSEIERIKFVLNNKTEIEVIDGILKEGVEVTINSGVLKGYKGKVVELSGTKKLIIEIESINKTMLITIDKDSLIKV